MGIRTKNLHNYILGLKVTKTISATLNVDAIVVPFSGFVSNIIATFSSLGTGAYPILDVNKNGATIFGDATKITGNTGSNTFGYSDLTSDHLGVVAGDIISLDVDTAGTAAVNALVNITISKTSIKQPSHLYSQDEAM
jgi:hypothetical protein